jgi:putative transposase
VIEHGRRRVLYFNSTADWVVQQLREAFPEAAPYRYARSSSCGPRAWSQSARVFRPRGKTGLRNAGWEAAAVEMFDHVIVLNEKHLRRLIPAYVNYHHEDRIHDSLQKDTTNRRVVERSSPNAKVISSARVGGLHHRYRWGEAA